MCLLRSAKGRMDEQRRGARVPVRACLLSQERNTAVGAKCEKFSYQTPFSAHGAHSSSVAVCVQENGKHFSKNIAVCEIFFSGWINVFLSPLTHW